MANKYKGQGYLVDTTHIEGYSGGSTGGAEVYYQQTQPTFTTGKGMWWQTDASGNIVTLWVQTG